MSDYYKAYDKRYEESHNNNALWMSNNPSKMVMKVIDKYNIDKCSDILELGCGEGRDAINLLKNGYNVLGLDYSINAINKCNELTKNKYVDIFKQFDFFEDTLLEKFDFIYSVAVIHMFMIQKHRDKFYQFIYDHLKDNGFALIIAMGDGKTEYSSSIDEAFLKRMRININTGEKMLVSNTTCMIKKLDDMIKEIRNNNFEIIENGIDYSLDDFSDCMYFVIRKD